MKCPNDDTVLVMSERQGIEIDYCPTCRGVWLDRGELDKIIERSANEYREPKVRLASTEPPREPVHQKDYHHDRPSEYDQQPPHYQKKKKRESFLGDLFDF